MSKDFVLITAKNEKIAITTFGFENLNSSPCIIIVHGFKGFKDWGFFPFVGSHFAKKGYFVITFNFSHNGIGNKLTEFTELDKFAENTISLEVSELLELIGAYKNNFFGIVKNNPIGLIGHSRGGAVSIIAAGKEAEVKALAVWASISKLDRYSERQKAQWKKNRVMEVVNSRTKQKMKLNLSLLEDIEDNKETTLNIKKAIEKLNRPLLIAHGEQDLTVKIEEGELLYNWSDKSSTEFYKITATGHTFNSGHPFEGSNKKLDMLINKTEKFFDKKLN